MGRPTDYTRSRHADPAADAGDELAETGSDNDIEGGSPAAAFGAGLVLGIAVGAGIALLLAPKSGEETREWIGGRARELGGRVSDRWDDLRDDIRRGARRKRRELRRELRKKMGM